jgi:acetoacetate decarboxylase
VADGSEAGPQINPGDIVNWPMLKIVYRTDPECIAALLPPGITPGKNPHVHLTVYNFPVHEEPEYGVVTTVEANFDGAEGLYALGYGIDQEAAIFISQEMNGQPKYPCDVRFYRMGNQVTAKCTHQGYTFVEFNGEAKEVLENPPTYTENEWWIKVSRAAGMGPSDDYDFPPHVVRVHSTYGTARLEEVEGQVVLGDSPWDPIKRLLPLREQVSARLWTPIFLGREIGLAGKLDPAGFAPFADVISGSRWPGQAGGPRPSAD